MATFSAVAGCLVVLLLTLWLVNGRQAPVEAGNTDVPSQLPSPSPQVTDPHSSPATPTTDPTTDASVEPTPGQGTALQALAELEVAPEDSFDNYSRDPFGYRTFDHDHNGCDTRNDVLRRDLVDVSVRPGTQGCKVDEGILNDPYTGTQINFVVGGGPSSDGGVQIDHVVALSDAWVTGAQGWDDETMVEFGNDPLNLLAVDGEANQSKGGSDASEWLPDNVGFRCSYVARQIAVKLAYDLWVTADEQDAMLTVLDTCPDEELPTSAETATP